MRNLLFFLFSCILITTINAQEVGLKIGLSFGKADYEYPYAPYDISTSYLTGFLAGFVLETSLSENVSLNPEILISLKGSKITMSRNEVKFPIYYLEFPLTVTYKFDLQKSKFFIHTGPYLGAGLSAEMQSAGKVVTVEFGSGTEQIKRIDFGFIFGLGLEIKRLQLGINYDLGIVNLSNDYNEKLKNGVISITSAFFFKY